MKKLVSILLAAILALGVMSAAAVPAAAFITLSPTRPGAWFATADEAAVAFATDYIPRTLAQGVEYGATIYRTLNWRTMQFGYTYTRPNRGNAYSVSVQPPLPLLLLPFLLAGDIHTHPKGGGNIFSEIDINGANAMAERWPSYQYMYLAAPNGSVRRFEMATQKIIVIHTGIDTSAGESAAPAGVRSADSAGERVGVTGFGSMFMRD